MSGPWILAGRLEKNKKMAWGLFLSALCKGNGKNIKHIAF